MNKQVSYLIIIILLGTSVIFGWLYFGSEEGDNNLANDIVLADQPGSIIDLNAKTDPSQGAAETSTWSVAEDGLSGYTLRFPPGWARVPSDQFMVAPERFVENNQYISVALPIISVMTSSNTYTPPWWREITLASGTPVYYSFEDGFDHYHVVNREVMLTFSVPARSFDGLYTDEELRQAVQIVNTYQVLE